MVHPNNTDSRLSYVALNSEQSHVLHLCIEWHSMFFTGAAGVCLQRLRMAYPHWHCHWGTGKSLLLHAVICVLYHKYTKEPRAVAVTASTGMAASNIGGEYIQQVAIHLSLTIWPYSSGLTLHAWGAILPMSNNIDQIVKYVWHCKPAFQCWTRARVLVINEGKRVILTSIGETLIPLPSLHGWWDILWAYQWCCKETLTMWPPLWWFAGRCLTSVFSCTLPSEPVFHRLLLLETSSSYHP